MRIIDSVEELRMLTGTEVAVSEWFEVTLDRIQQFADATEDGQWIHIDAARARAESPYGAPIAHGFLTLSLLSHLSRESVEVRGDFKMRINYGLNRVRFPAAVRAGDRVRARFTVQSVEDIAGGVQLVWAVTIEIEGGGKPACVAEWLTRLYR
jgi:acyl dehydratase